MYIVLGFVECCIMGGHDDLHVRVIAEAAIGCSVIRRIYTSEISLSKNSLLKLLCAIPLDIRVHHKTVPA